MKTYRIAAIIIFGGLCITLIWKTYRLQEKKNTGLKEISNLPALPFLFLKRGMNAAGHPVIINFFHPGCEHCQYVASRLVRADSILKKISFIMITRANREASEKFIKEFELQKLNNLSIAIDTSDQSLTLFGSNQVPSFFIYDQQHHLIKKITGEASVELLGGICLNLDYRD